MLDSHQILFKFIKLMLIIDNNRLTNKMSIKNLVESQNSELSKSVLLQKNSSLFDNLATDFGKQYYHILNHYIVSIGDSR